MIWTEQIQWNYFRHSVDMIHTLDKFIDTIDTNFDWIFTDMVFEIAYILTWETASYYILTNDTIVKEAVTN